MLLRATSKRLLSGRRILALFVLLHLSALAVAEYGHLVFHEPRTLSAAAGGQEDHGCAGTHFHARAVSISGPCAICAASRLRAPGGPSIGAWSVLRRAVSVSRDDEGEPSVALRSSSLSRAPPRA